MQILKIVKLWNPQNGIKSVFKKYSLFFDKYCAICSFCATCSFILKEQNMHIYFRFIWMGTDDPKPKYGVVCYFLLPTGGDLCLCREACAIELWVTCQPELFTCLLLLLLLLLLLQWRIVGYVWGGRRRRSARSYYVLQRRTRSCLYCTHGAVQLRAQLGWLLAPHACLQCMHAPVIMRDFGDATQAATWDPPPTHTPSPPL